SRTTSTRSTSRRRWAWTNGALAPAGRRQCQSPSLTQACSGRRRSDRVALFSYFPNYIWNLSVAIAMESGAQIGEILDMCQPIKNAADSGADAGTPQFMAQWAAMGEKLLELAAEDEGKGRAF